MVKENGLTRLADLPMGLYLVVAEGPEREGTTFLVTNVCSKGGNIPGNPRSGIGWGGRQPKTGRLRRPAVLLTAGLPCIVIGLIHRRREEYGQGENPLWNAVCAMAGFIIQTEDSYRGIRKYSHGNHRNRQ